MTDSMPRLVIRTAEQGRVIRAAGDLYRFLALSSETGGRAGVWDAEIPPGGGPPRHVHRRESEAFFVYEGEIEFEADNRRVRIGRGGYLQVPENTPHAFWNPTTAPARMLIMIFPGGMEGMFAKTGTPARVGDPAGGPIDSAEIERLKAAAPGYGIELLGPPLSASR